MINTGLANAKGSRVELRFKCENLRNTDLLSLTDPRVIVYLKGPLEDRYTEIGRTEAIKNNLNPEFATAVSINYTFETEQTLVFEVTDDGDKRSTLGAQRYIGYYSTTLGSLLASPRTAGYKKPLNPNRYNLPLHRHNRAHKPTGFITITANEVKTDKSTAVLRFSAKNIDKKDLFGQSDGFLKLYSFAVPSATIDSPEFKTQTSMQEAQWTLVHRTEVIKDNRNPAWQTFSISFGTLCHANQRGPIKIVCYDWDSNGKEDLIGSTIVCFDELVQHAKQGTPFSLINQRKQEKSKKYDNSGLLYVNSAEIQHRYSLVDYVQGGLQLHLVLGIDYTASNGDPLMPQSHHHRRHGVYNVYQEVIRDVGKIHLDYSSDKKIHAYGFGAQFTANQLVSHCFPLTFNDANTGITGINHLIDMYSASFKHIKLYGPTNFEPIIRKALQYAQTCTQINLSYVTLMIITDGAISDLPKTIDALVDASYYAISLVIVGIGNADFSSMDRLDSDKALLVSSTGKRAARDIVQFVPYNSAKRGGAANLAKCVLEELPQSILEFMQKSKLFPNKARPASLSSVQTTDLNAKMNISFDELEAELPYYAEYIPNSDLAPVNPVYGAPPPQPPLQTYPTTQYPHTSSSSLHPYPSSHYGAPVGPPGAYPPHVPPTTAYNMPPPPAAHYSPQQQIAPQSHQPHQYHQGHLASYPTNQYASGVLPGQHDPNAPPMMTHQAGASQQMYYAQQPPPGVVYGGQYPSTPQAQAPPGGSIYLPPNPNPNPGHQHYPYQPPPSY